MSSTLSVIDPHKRRQVAATLGLFAVLFVAVGTVAATGADTAVVKAFVVIALLVAVFLALMAWGVARSIKADLAEQRLDAVIERAVEANGGAACGCGHDHDPSEMHLVGDERERRVGEDRESSPDEPCSRDGHGSACTHTCETCALATLREAPEHELVPSRPSPHPRPAAERRPSPRAS